MHCVKIKYSGPFFIKFSDLCTVYLYLFIQNMHSIVLVLNLCFSKNESSWFWSISNGSCSTFSHWYPKTLNNISTNYTSTLSNQSKKSFSLSSKINISISEPVYINISAQNTFFNLITQTSTLYLFQIPLRLDLYFDFYLKLLATQTIDRPKLLIDIKLW